MVVEGEEGDGVYEVEIREGCGGGCVVGCGFVSISHEWRFRGLNVLKSTANDVTKRRLLTQRRTQLSV